jgi:hypothetical protein
LFEIAFMSEVGNRLLAGVTQRLHCVFLDRHRIDGFRMNETSPILWIFSNSVKGCG